MRDGLWIVDEPHFYAAFVISGGRVTTCAPILRKNIGMWMMRAHWVPTANDPEEDDYPPPWRKDC